MRKRQKREERVQIQNNNKDHAVYYTLFMSISRGKYRLLKGEKGGYIIKDACFAFNSDLGTLAFKFPVEWMGPTLMRRGEMMQICLIREKAHDISHTRDSYSVPKSKEKEQLIQLVYHTQSTLSINSHP